MKVFISYSQTDAEFSDRLRDSIRAMSHDTWRDVDDIPKGANWDDAIDVGLRTCDVVVGVLSPDSVASDNVKNEWAWSLSNRKPLILLLHRPCAIPHRYVRINYIDFTLDEETAFAQLEMAIADSYQAIHEAIPELEAVSSIDSKDVVGSPSVTGDDVAMRRRTTFSGPTSREDMLALRNRRVLIEKVESFWIKGVLEHSLHGAALLELGMQEQPDAIEHPWKMVLQTLGWQSQSIPPETQIIDIFDEMGRAMLILGEPGSGKTTTMLELARDTIARAKESAEQPVPVVFNLSSWSDGNKDITEWLVEELNTKYLLPTQVGAQLVKQERLLLLLDGLDEVRLEQRTLCVEAINHFRHEHGMTPLVVCSRVADYEALSARLKLEGAVLLQPLSTGQIEGYLANAGEKLAVLKIALQSDVALQELAQSPLMLSIMTLAYQGAASDSLPLLATADAHRKHLFAAYVRRMFERRVSSKHNSPQQTIQWLAWLAQRMMEHAETVFLIERMQPSWLATKKQQRTYAIASRIAGGLLGGLIIGLPGLLGEMLIFGLLGWWAGDTPEMLWMGARLGATGGLIIALAGMLGGALIVGQNVKGSIETIESLKWSWPGAIRGLIVGLAGGVFGGIIGAPIAAWKGLNAWLVTSILIGIISGISFGLSFALVGGLSGKQIEIHTTPNQGIWQSLRNALIVTLSSGFMVGLIGFLTMAGSGIVNRVNPAVAYTDAPQSMAIGLSNALSFEALSIGLCIGFGGGLIVGLITGLFFGGRTVIRHLTLRYLLLREGHVPWRYADFLDHAAECIFLRKVGGGYIFVHRLLMEYFASLAA